MCICTVTYGDPLWILGTRSKSNWALFKWLISRVQLRQGEWVIKARPMILLAWKWAEARQGNSHENTEWRCSVAPYVCIIPLYRQLPNSNLLREGLRLITWASIPPKGLPRNTCFALLPPVTTARNTQIINHKCEKKWNVETWNRWNHTMPTCQNVMKVTKSRPIYITISPLYPNLLTLSYLSHLFHWIQPSHPQHRKVRKSRTPRIKAGATRITRTKPA